jgi:hypothetical protein
MCVHTAHTVDAADQTVGLELRNRATSHASIACMRVTPKSAHPAAENPLPLTHTINRISLPIPKFCPDGKAVFPAEGLLANALSPQAVQ